MGWHCKFEHKQIQDGMVHYVPILNMQSLSEFTRKGWGYINDYIVRSRRGREGGREGDVCMQIYAIQLFILEIPH